MSSAAGAGKRTKPKSSSTVVPKLKIPIAEAKYHCRHCDDVHTADAFNAEQLKRAKKGNVARCRVYFRELALARSYHMTISQWNTLWNEQKGMCAICTDKLVRDKTTHVDHDHDTGKVRALLCANCNKGIGLLKDSALVCARAAVYLARHKGTTTKDLDAIVALGHLS
jgi:hypothetical protein